MRRLTNRVIEVEMNNFKITPERLLFERKGLAMCLGHLT